MTKTEAHRWEFRARFRRHAFGWKSQPAIKRIKEAVSEIKKVARRDKVLAAEGTVLFLEKVSPAIEQVDGSSGSIGTAVNNAIAALVPVVAEAPTDAEARAAWLERLFEAHAEEGKWFAAAKSAKLFDKAIALANRTPCSLQTLTLALDADGARG